MTFNLDQTKILSFGKELIVTYHAKRNLVGIAKNIEPGQPAQSAQSDDGRTLRYWQILCLSKC